MSELHNKVCDIKGIGEARARGLTRLGINSVYDLLTYFPQRYEDRRLPRNIALVNDQETALVSGQVVSVVRKVLRTRKTLLNIRVSDNSGFLTLTAFNQPYLKDILLPGVNVNIFAKFTRGLAGLEASAFSYELTGRLGQPLIHTGRIVPVYGLTAGITQKWLRRLIWGALEKYSCCYGEFIPEKILRAENLPAFSEAIRAVHFPESSASAEAAGKRFIMEEFLLLQGALALRKRASGRAQKPYSYTLRKNLLSPFREKLGFEFTRDQKKAINEIFEDLMSPHPMKRLLQGEVGSGKTVVAVSALLLAVENGYQGAVLAPTEILAEQHFLTLSRLLGGMGVEVELLMGGVTGKKRVEKLEKISSGAVDIVVGTHALLQKDVDLSRASVMVIDEQHRFGVRQKALLKNKRGAADVLSMSATPIPRTMALCAYGDYDVSVIRELPLDRKPPVTRWAEEEEAYCSALKEIEDGGQVFIVHPLVEDSDKMELKSACSRYEELSGSVFSQYPCALLHGRMTSEEKTAVMKDFAAGRYKVLFTTTVIEVGIDIPGASLMIIENYSRYGLAALHQLRGRIARGSRQPYCFLTGADCSEPAARRLEIITGTHDGFRIADEDMRLRGSGELFGVRQHGLMEFRIADPVRDFDALKRARRYAFEIIGADVSLSAPGNVSFRKMIMEIYGRKMHLADIG